VQLPVIVLLGWLVMWAAARAFTIVATDPVWQDRIPICTAVAVAVTGAAAALVGRRRPAVAAAIVLTVTAVLLSGLATWGLHGTRWGFEGLSADAAYRSEAAMRYADTLRLADYAYRDLPAYYPPALGWIEGRVAALTGIPGWSAVKPLQLILAAVIPLLAYALWRRLVAPLPAALVVLATSLLTADLHKPDEWLVLACAVPWWLDAFRGARAADRQPWSPWRHGVIAGLFLLTHTFFLLPLAVATLLGVALDLARRRPLALPPRQGTVVVLVGLLVSFPYWLGLAVARLTTPSDELQLRFSPSGADTPSWPWPDDPAALLGLVGVLWLMVTARRDRLSAALGLALVAGYLTVIGGEVLQRVDVGLLTFKADALVVTVQVAAGVLALVDITTRWAVRLSHPVAVPQAVGLLLTAALVAPMAVRFADVWATGGPALLAHDTRYPSGAWPEGHTEGGRVAAPAFTGAWDPPVQQVLHAWHDLSGRTDDSSTVLVTTRVDLLATTTLHPFITWKSIYSHPNGQFEDRVRLLRQVASCADSSCAAELLRDNPYDAVDGLVLNRLGDDLLMPYEVDRFPDRLRREEVVFPAELFRGPDFRVTAVGRVTIIQVL
jgi:galactan 5-O-arabinofuranosyltransferase